MNRERRIEVNFYPVLKQFIGIKAKFLEIGVFRGIMSDWFLENILTHPESLFIGIDPWEKKLFNTHDVCDDNDWENLLMRIEGIKQIYGNKVQFIKGYSQDIIPKMNWDKNSFDFIYIDGEHSRKAVTLDFDMSWPLLKINGIIILDDYLIRNNRQMKPAIDEILKIYSGKYELLFVNRQVGLRKLAE